MGRHRGPWLLIFVAVLLAGCSRTVHNDAGLLTMPNGWHFGPSGDASVNVVGTARLEGSCWYLSNGSSVRSLIVWPNGSAWSDDQHTGVRLPDGPVVTSGTDILGVGGEDDRTPPDAQDLGPCLPEPPAVARFSQASVR